MFSIFGSPRSGTTLLASIISLHPNLFVPYETDFIIPTAFIFDRVQDPIVGKRLISELIFSTSGFTRLKRYLSIEEVNSCPQEADYKLYVIIKSIFDLIAMNTGVTMVGDKSPNDPASPLC